LLSFDLAAMAGRQAKIISEAIYKDLLVFASTTRYPFRNRLLVLLSVKAGLRAGEIANLTWDMVLNPHGEVGTVIELQDWAAKKHSGRLIPIHPDLHDGLVVWRKSVLPFGTLISSERGQGMRPVSIVNWFAKAYQAIGAEGCSSHSGRRTFITRAARLAHEAGGSLRDVRSWRVTGRFKRHSGTSTVTPMRSASWFRSFDGGGQSKSPSHSRPEAKSSSPQQKRGWHGSHLALAPTRCARSRRSGGAQCLLSGWFGQPDR
jgi:hypothetical protein